MPDPITPEEHHKQHTELAESIRVVDMKTHQEIEDLAEAILGEKRPEILGGGRDPKGSLSEKIEQNARMITSIYDDSVNGGLKTRLSRGIVALLVAIIGAVGVLGQAVIAHRSDTAQLGQELDHKFDELRQEIITELEALP